MYILRKDIILNVDINIDKTKLNDIIESMYEKKKISNENDIIYSRFISLIEEIKDYGFVHDGKNLLEFLADYKLFQRYSYESKKVFEKKLQNYETVNDEILKNVVLNLSNCNFAGLYGNKLQTDLKNVIECFRVKENNTYSPISQIEIHKKISDASISLNKEALLQWKNLYFSSVRNNNLINILKIRDDTTKKLIRRGVK